MVKYDPDYCGEVLWQPGRCRRIQSYRFCNQTIPRFLFKRKPVTMSASHIAEHRKRCYRCSARLPLCRCRGSLTSRPYPAILWEMCRHLRPHQFHPTRLRRSPELVLGGSRSSFGWKPQIADAPMGTDTSPLPWRRRSLSLTAHNRGADLAFRVLYAGDDGFEPLVMSLPRRLASPPIVPSPNQSSHHLGREGILAWGLTLLTGTRTWALAVMGSRPRTCRQRVGTGTKPGRRRDQRRFAAMSPNAVLGDDDASPGFGHYANWRRCLTSSPQIPAASVYSPLREVRVIRPPAVGGR